MGLWQRLRGRSISSKEAKQGTGPASMFWVVIISTALAALAMAIIYSFYFQV